MKELQVTIKAEVIIVPEKTRVRFVSPGRGDDYASNRFFEKYDGKTGTIMGYCTEYVGVHNRGHRKPGVYVQRGDMGNERFTPIKVLFDGEPEVRVVKFCHLALIGGFDLPDGERSPDQWYIGELPEEVAFYPGDTVCLREDLLQTPREVRYVSFTEDGGVRYDLNHSSEEAESIRTAEQAEDEQKPRAFRMASQLDFAAVTKRKRGDLVLLKRGRLYVLHHGNPDELEFGSLEEEITFWSQRDLSVRYGSEDKYGFEQNRLPVSLELLRSGEADVIHHLECVIPYSYDPRRLHPAFERFRARARKASIAYWEQQPEKKDERRYG